MSGKKGSSQSVPGVPDAHDENAIKNLYKSLRGKERGKFTVTPPPGTKVSPEDMQKAGISLRYLKCIAEQVDEKTFVTAMKNDDLPPIKLSKADMAFMSGGELKIKVKLPGVEMDGTLPDYIDAGKKVVGWIPDPTIPHPGGPGWWAEYTHATYVWWSWVGSGF